MRNWLIGTGLVIGSVGLGALLVALGASRQFAVIISIAVATLGFIIQMHTAFSMMASSKREIKKSRQEYEALMRKAQELSPLEAIELLLKPLKTGEE